MIDENGWCKQAESLLSPNHDSRPAGTRINLIVIHNISLPPRQYGGSFIADLFLNRLDFDAHPYFNQLRALRVSAHFLIRRDGKLIQFVSINDRAWHAGVSDFQGRVQCNDFSVGIEMEGSDHEPFTGLQYTILAELTAALCVRYPITAVTGHEQIAPSRKTDPGPYFDWRRYEKDISALPESRPLSFPKPVTR
ncbi:MAG: 1,6-anhydro-N-acetylmuramyl-L-alanine amidase AmpD [Betaproteobacteria bacterium]|nr:1,6-anhydro-N-acetylmuramyl-L-alanine amidase AmpD [Betaproteobacteria bacterium]